MHLSINNGAAQYSSSVVLVPRRDQLHPFKVVVQKARRNCSGVRLDLYSIFIRSVTMRNVVRGKDEGTARDRRASVRSDGRGAGGNCDTAVIFTLCPLPSSRHQAPKLSVSCSPHTNIYRAIYVVRSSDRARSGHFSDRQLCSIYSSSSGHHSDNYASTSTRTNGQESLASTEPAGSQIALTESVSLSSCGGKIASAN